MATTEAKTVYRKRAPTAETPFGFIKGVMGYRKFLRRGIKAVRAEWAAICTAYNISKLMRIWPVATAG
jgi:hypothetical protein